MDASLRCFADARCTAAYREEDVRLFLDGAQLVLVQKLRRETDLAILKAEGLVECPFCPYAVILDDATEETTLDCLNPVTGSCTTINAWRPRPTRPWLTALSVFVPLLAPPSTHDPPPSTQPIDTARMARSPRVGDSPTSTTAAESDRLPLIVLTADELAGAPHAVLVSLVERQQDELVRFGSRLERLVDEIGEEREQRRRLEREVDGARARVDELLAEQARMEEELGGRIEVLDKLRGTIRDLEREKREMTKRYREQSETFDSERQTWYDQEQHFRLRISNLSAGHKRTSRRAGRKSAPADMRIDEYADESADGDQPPETPRADAPPPRSSTSSPAPSGTSTRSTTPSTSATSDAPSGPSATELSLRAQLDTLTTAHSSLSSTLHKLQAEMSDLKRVYQDVQEQNESYEILLGEKTLSGEVRTTALFRQSFSWGESGLGDDDDPLGGAPPGGVASGGAFGFAGGLDPVGEEGELPLSSDEALSTDGEGDADDPARDSDDVDPGLLDSDGAHSATSGALTTSRAARRRSRREASLASAAPGGGGSGGIDLAAELEAAVQHADLSADEAERRRGKEERRQQRREEKSQRKKAAAAQARRDGSFPGATEGELHDEIRHLRDANKALTLYVSKIVDRVCSQEGFEKVLAVDYRTTPKAGAPGSPPPPGPPVPDKKPRPASIGFFRPSATTTPSPATTRRVEPSTPMSAASFVTAPIATPTPASGNGASTGPRKPGGFGWDSVASVFSLGRSASGTPSPSPSVAGAGTPAGMKPLMLADSARKLELGDEIEDDEDRRERARIRAEMAQLGFSPPPPSRLAAGAGAGTGGSPSRSPGESSLQENERVRALDALEKQDAVRGTALTEMPQRRLSLLGQRRISMRANGELGLGINEVPVEGEGIGAGAGAPASTRDAGAAVEGGARKALRRLSAAWSSPPLGS
ncbi:hypothetical protein JCM3770_003206 [Rhodotorula araucariae]